MQRLPDPPHRVTDEVDPDIRIVLVRGAAQPSVRLAHQILEREPAMLVLLGDRDANRRFALINDLRPRTARRRTPGVADGFAQDPFWSAADSTGIRPSSPM